MKFVGLLLIAIGAVGTMSHIMARIETIVRKEIGLYWGRWFSGAVLSVYILLLGLTLYY